MNFERDSLLGFSKVHSALKGLLSPDELTGEQQEGYLDKLFNGNWESSPVSDAFFEDRRQRGVGVGMDEEGNIVHAAPTKVLVKDLEDSMNFDRALAIFEHALDHDSRESPAIRSALLKLVDQEVIDAASQVVSEALSLGQRVWMTSDLHLGHANIIGYCDRPFHDAQSMDAALLQLLGKVVPGELLVIVGDIALAKYSEAMALLKSMPGRKILVAGNHDFERTGKPRFLCDPSVFEAVVPFLYWTGPQDRSVLVSHHPVGCPAHLTTARALLNYHGHLHQQVLAPTESVKYMNVGWDVDYALRCL